MANYDEVVKRNKDYLTQAQINALAAASKEYNIANAGNRAGALASAREQYDTAYRGLQNMGLAGNPNAAPASACVPRPVSCRSVSRFSVLQRRSRMLPRR